MSMRSILVPVFPNKELVEPCEAALQIARQVGAHIDAVFVRADPTETLVAVPELAVAITLEQIEKEGRAAEAKARQAFEAWRDGAQVDSTAPGDARDAVFAGWTEYVGATETLLVERGRLSDLIVFGRDNDSFGRYAFNLAVFNSGKPTLLVSKAVQPNLLDHVVISWNGSVEAAHAVMGSMAILRHADRVSVFSAASPRTEAAAGEKLAEALHWHGIDVACLPPRKDDISVGAALLDAAERERASLIVMGAYTHGRVHQLLLGGVTRHVLDHATIPVVMAH
jgi:nucleotide-binding universal stress UspA family protein